MKWIPYSHFQNSEDHISNLYKDYLTNFDALRHYYTATYREKTGWEKIINHTLSRSINRSALVRVLHHYNKEHQCGIKTLANIDLLHDENTLAVVTGQQLGICTGPLYTIYKTITAIKLTQQLSQNFPNYNFVPIFWLECEDHDFEEINKLSFINNANEITTSHYLLEGKPLEKNLGAVGNITIDNFITQFFTEMEQSFQKTEFTTPLFDMIQSYYKSGNTFLQSFVGFMNRLFEDDGLIFLNPNTPELKNLAKPLFKKELESVTEVSKIVIKQSAELEEQYHAQIKAKAVNLFMFHKGGRYAIEPSEDGTYYLKNTRQRFSQEELLNLVEKSPEIFSPNVVMRPLYQDTLLPTVGYIAGPSEIAYFAQLQPVYDFFGMTMPIIYPRASVTIVEEKVKKVLEKFQLNILEFFGDVEPLLARIAEQVSEVKVDNVFLQLHTNFSEALKEAQFGITQIDPTLDGTLKTTQAKIESLLTVLKEKTQKAQQQKQDISLRQIQKASLYLFPKENFQERELNVLYFMNKYGLEFVQWISGEIDINHFQHQLIEI